MASERSESARDNFGKLIHQFQSETKTLIRKLVRIFKNHIDKMCLYYSIKHAYMKDCCPTIYICANTPRSADPYYLSFLKPNYSWPVIHLVGFSHLRPGALHISLQTHKTLPRGWKKRTNEQTRGWVSSKCKRREFVTLLCSSPCIWWCNGYRRRIWTRRHEFKSWTWLIAFHMALIPLGKVWIQLFSLQLWVNSRAD